MQPLNLFRRETHFKIVKVSKIFVEEKSEKLWKFKVTSNWQYLPTNELLYLTSLAFEFLLVLKG